MSQSASSIDPSARRHVLLTLALFVVLTGYFTYPLWTDPAGQLNELWDVRLNAWIMAWDAHAIVSQPGSLFDANIFYPHARTLAFSENLLGNALWVAPINWLGEPILAYNIVLFAGFILSGVAMSLWVRALTGSFGAGVVAGMIWAFAPSKMDHIPQIQLLTGQWITFALVALTRYAQTGRRRMLLAGALLVGWQYLAGIQITLLLLPAVGLYTAALMIAYGTWQKRGAVLVGKDLLLAALIAAVLMIPVSLPYLTVSEAEGFVRGEHEVQGLSAQPKAYLSPSAWNRAPHMQWLHDRYRMTEANHFLGIVVLSILLPGTLVLGLRRLRRPRAHAAEPTATGHRAREWLHRITTVLTFTSGGLLLFALIGARWPTLPAAENIVTIAATLHVTIWLAVSGALALLTRGRIEDCSDAAIVAPVALYLVLLGFLLSLGLEVRAWGHDLGLGPYWLFYHYGVPYRSIRSAGRFGLAMLLFAALLAGIVVTRMQLALRTRLAGGAGDLLSRALPIVLVLGIAWEYRTLPFPAENARVPDPEVYDYLASLPGDAAVLHIPVIRRGYPPSATQYMLGSTRHWKPLVNGFSGFWLPEVAELNRIEAFTPEFFDTMRSQFEVDYIVMHGHQISVGAYEALSQRALAARREIAVEKLFDNSVIYRVKQRVERGTQVFRRYSARRLAPGSTLTFEARPLGQPRGGLVEVRWNRTEVGQFPLGNEWRPYEVSLGRDLVPWPDGTVGLTWKTSRAAVPLGNTGSSITPELLIDVQVDFIGLGVNDEWVVRAEDDTAIIAVFDREARTLSEARGFGPHVEGLEDLAAFIEAVPAGSIVVLGYRDITRASPSLRARLAAALGALGSTLTPDSLPPRLALVSARGAPTATSIEQWGERRAVVRVGAPLAPPPRFALRNVLIQPPD